MLGVLRGEIRVELQDPTHRICSTVWYTAEGNADHSQAQNDAYTVAAAEGKSATFDGLVVSC